MNQAVGQKLGAIVFSDTFLPLHPLSKDPDWNTVTELVYQQLMLLLHEKEIGVYIDRTYVVRQDLIAGLKAPNIDITPEQWVILSQLEDKTLTQVELAGKSFKDKYTVSLNY